MDYAKGVRVMIKKFFTLIKLYLYILLIQVLEEVIDLIEKK